MRPRGLTTALGSILILTLMASTASAQSLYIGGTAIADIRRFDSVELDPRALSILGDISSRDGIAAGGGLRVGTFLHPLWSLELAVDAGDRITSAFLNPIERLPTRSSTLRLPEISTSTSFVTVSTVVGFHPEKAGRVRLGYFGGLALVRGKYETTFPDFSYFPIDVEFFAELGSIPGLSSVQLPAPTVASQTLRHSDNSAGAVLGFEAAVDVTRRFAVVPGIRTIVFSNGGQTVFLIRPEAGVRWSF